MKIRKDGNLAAGAPTFIDDGRSTGPSKEIAEAAAHQLSSRINSLGEQDASRKRRPVSLTPGAWTGKLLHCNLPHPRKAVLHEKWTEFRMELIELIKAGHSSDPQVEYKTLQ